MNYFYILWAIVNLLLLLLFLLSADGLFRKPERNYSFT